MNSAYKSTELLGRPMQIRFTENVMAQIDEYGKAERMPSRSEAIRALVKKGLEEETSKK